MLPPRGSGGGSGSTRATLEWLGARPPRPIACVGGAGGSQAYGRPRRSVRRSGGSRTPVSGSIARPSIVPAEVGGRMSVGGCPPARSQRTLAGESPGPPSSSEGLGRSVVTGARRSGESTSGSATTDRPPTLRGRMSPMGNGLPFAASRPGSMVRPRQGPDRPLPWPTGRDADPRPGRQARACVGELAHAVHQATLAGTAGGERRGRGELRDAGRARLARPGEELRESALGLEVPADHHAVVRLERLRDPVHERPRKAQRVAHLADRGTRPVGDEVADHPRVLGAVALVDVLDHLLPSLGGEVDVHVRIRGPALVDEPLEQQLVADRVPRVIEHVRDDRVRRAPHPAPGCGATSRTASGPSRSGRTPSPVFWITSARGPAGARPRASSGGSGASPIPAQRREVAERRLALGHVEARKR